MILTGAPGSGKSAVLDALTTLLEVEGLAFGAIESEQLARGWPWLEPDQWLRHLAAVVALQRESGRETLLVVATTENEQELRAVADALAPSRPLVVCLTAPPQLVAERVARREPDEWPGKQALIEHARELADIIPSLEGIDVVISTIDRDARDVAAEIKELLTAGGILGGGLPRPPAVPVPAFTLDEQTELRLLEDADLDELHALIVANRNYLAQWMPWAANQTREGTLAFIRSTRRQLAENKGFQLVIVADGRIVGELGFHRVDWENGSTSIGYWIEQKAQGHGIVTRAVAALADHAFRVWKLNRVEIRAAVDNERSRAVPRRLGFKEEGVLCQAERLGDHFVDHVVYAMLAEEWAGLA